MQRESLLLRVLARALDVDVCEDGGRGGRRGAADVVVEGGEGGGGGEVEVGDGVSCELEEAFGELKKQINIHAHNLRKRGGGINSQRT